MPADPRSILIIKTTSLGDVVHAVPTLRALRGRHPAARIEWLIDARYEAVIAGHGALDAAIPVRSAGLPGLPASADHLLRGAFHLAGAARLRARRFDLVIDLQGLLRSAVMGVLAGARRRRGPADARELAPLLYTEPTAPSPWAHAVERCLAAAGFAVAEPQVPRFDLPVDPAAAARAAARVPADRPYAVLAPRSSRPDKDWPAAGYAEVARALAARGRTVVLLGGADDAAACRAIADSARTGLPAVGWPTAEAIALLAGAEVFVGGDSGPLHLAAALGRPAIGLFGPTDPARTGPRGPAARVLRHRPLHELPPEAVLAAIAANAEVRRSECRVMNHSGCE
jgi:lipopolysaccharide heptosyltransferase I